MMMEAKVDVPNSNNAEAEDFNFESRDDHEMAILGKQQQFKVSNFIGLQCSSS